MHSDRNIIAEKIGKSRNESLERRPDGSAILWFKHHKRQSNGLAEFGAPVPAPDIEALIRERGMALNSSPSDA